MKVKEVMKKGFTLVEIIVVMVIVGVLAALAFFNYNNSIWQSKVQAVENNLMAIAAAEQRYYEDYPGYYCVTSTPTPLPTDCGYNQITINSNLNLSMSVVNDGFSYSCSGSGTPGAAGYTYTCTASNPNTPSLISQSNLITISPGGSLVCEYNSPSPPIAIVNPCP